MASTLAACSAGAEGGTPAAGKDLRSAIRGRILLPGDEGFDLAARPWNSTIDQSVRAVAHIADADDAAALVRYAHSAGMSLAVQPIGHGASGAAEGTILVRTDQLDQLRIDAGARSARVGAGVSWNAVQAASAAANLTGAPGSSSAVSVAGYTLGGGLSWFGRKYGWAADNVKAFDVIDAQGRRLRATADTEADLYWALRGGGGDFALVTAIELELHPAPTLYGGRMLWPVQRAPEVLAAFRSVTGQAPNELTVWFSLFQFPKAPPMVGIDATYLGDAAEGSRLLRQFDDIGGRVSDTRSTMAFTALDSITTEPSTPTPSRHRAAFLADLDDAAVGKLLAEPVAPLLSVQIRHLGGALAEPSDSPASAISERYYIGFLGIQTKPDDAAAIQARSQKYLDALGPELIGRTPFTMLTPGQTARDAFSHDIIDRLREIKRARDPHGLFRSNYQVLD
nr:FAD-binding protein [Nocardia coubleae]